MKKLPKEIKCDIFDMLSHREANDLLDYITNFLCEKYGYTPSFCYEINVELTDITWEK